LYSGSVDSAWVVARPYSYGWWWWANDPATRNLKRVGSYAANNWINGSGWGWYNSSYPWQKETFLNETQIRDSSRTPLFADGVDAWWWGGGLGGDREPQIFQRET